MAYKLSPSSLSLMAECPRCFWLNKNKVWTRPSSPFPQLPNGMDRIIKAHFDAFRDKGKLPPEIKDSKDMKCVKLFDDKELLTLWRNNRKGIQYSDKEGNTLTGAVDNLLVKGKKIIVIDFKTKGSALKDETEAGDYYQNQLDFYNFLLRQNGYETEDYAYLLFYYPKEVLEDGKVVFDTCLIKRSVDVKNAENIFNKAIKLLTSKCPEKHCEWCASVKI